MTGPNVPMHVTLAREAWEAGLIVTLLMPAAYGRGFNVTLWQPDGTLWAEDRNASSALVHARIHHWPAHRQAHAGLRLVNPDTGQALPCGCIDDTTDTEET